MNVRYSTGPPYNPHDPEMWNLMAVPDYIRNGEEDIDKAENLDKSASLFTQFIGEILGSVPFVGGIAKAFSNLGLSAFNRNLQEDANWRNKLNARYADWYNSPVQQVLRLRKAGINPYVKDGVKSMPSVVPTYEPYLTPLQLGNNESLAGLINAFTNAKIAEHRIENLDSLTAINEYKEQYLLPQLFERNGYVNSIYQLQVAWETKNYDYERQVKQNILNTQYELSLIDTAKGIMENSAQIPGSYVKVNPVAGTLTVQIPDENGKMKDYGLHELPFDKLPPHLQKVLTDIWSERTMTNSKSQLNTIIGNTQSALGGLYNANREKVDIYVNEWREYKVWPDADPVLRAATGSLDWSNLWKMTGYNTANRAINTAMDIGAAFANPKYLLGGGNPYSYPYGNPPMASPISPQPLKIPRGAKPYTVNGQTYWYYPK